MEERESESLPNSQNEEPTRQNSASVGSQSVGEIPSRIGEYRILRKLGEGGMGVVYEAEQQHPRRLVALKIIRGGRYVDEHHIRLFQREVQALARLKHPGIASIYESGRTEEGHHYFAMELVRGQTLKEFLDCRSHQVAKSSEQLRERLGLFRRITDAVTYAHQRGVVHRDLKPSNILVQRDFSSDTGSDSTSAGIKILDFGLARITETDIAAVTVDSEVGRIRGTLPYMSPEQVSGNPDEIDIRTDVYSLGVILYELLTGERPYGVHQVMLQAAMYVICQQPPKPLSKTWSGVRIDKDLETIVLKALEKAPARRYQSVSALGDDVGRYLTGQAITAHPPSAAYQLRKLIARHKVGFGAAALLVVLLALFGVTMSIQAERIARARDRADREARIAEQTASFLVDLFEISDPFGQGGQALTAGQILERGAEKLEAELKEDLPMRASLLSTISKVYMNLGLFDKAAPMAEEALRLESKIESNDYNIAKNSDNLGTLRMYQGNYAEAADLYAKALEIWKKLRGRTSIEVANTMNNLGSLHYMEGEWKQAEEDFGEALRIHRELRGNEHLEVAACLDNLAITLNAMEKYAEAEPLYREALNTRRTLLGNDHPSVAQSLNNFGMHLLRRKMYSEAEQLFLQALSINRRAIGDENPETAANMNNLALLYNEQGLFPKAEEQLRQVLEIDGKIYGDVHPQTASTIQSLAFAVSEQARYEEAEQLYGRALGIKRALFSADHWEVATTQNLLGDCLTKAGEYERAERLLIESYRIIKAQFGNDHGRTKRAHERLVALYQAWGKPERIGELQ